MKRPFLCLWFTAVILGALAMPAIGGAPVNEDAVCGDKNTPAEERAAAFEENEDATILELSVFQADALLSRLEKMGMPETPKHDGAWIVKWPDGSASILLFQSGCRIAVANGLPFRVLEPALVGAPA